MSLTKFLLVLIKIKRVYTPLKFLLPLTHNVNVPTVPICEICHTWVTHKGPHGLSIVWATLSAQNLEVFWLV